MSDTFEGGGEKGKTGNILPFPERDDDKRGGFEIVAGDLNRRLTGLTGQLHITDENITARIKELRENKSVDAESLRQILQKGAGQQTEEFYKDRELVTYYLAAARVYLALPPAEKIEKEFEPRAQSILEEYGGKPGCTPAEISSKVKESLRTMRSGYTAILMSLTDDPDWKHVIAGDPIGYCAIATIYMRGLAE